MCVQVAGVDYVKILIAKVKFVYLKNWTEVHVAGVQSLQHRVLLNDFGNVNCGLTMQGLAGRDK